ncbi:MAG: hypothetical protein ACYTDX_01355 [Planctomycetota bacterium]|jgi:hypothetical protein
MLDEGNPSDPAPDGSNEKEPPATIRLRLDEIEKEALTGEGNYVYKITVDGELAVLKVYYGTRGLPTHLHKSVGNWITGRTSYMPKTRWRIETECIRTWEKHGFRCFKMMPWVEVEGLPREGYMVYQWTPGKHFRGYFRDKDIDVEEKMATWVRWIPEWHRRHAIAIETNDSSLIHENGDVKHVMLWEGDFVYFDFEMVFRSKNVRNLVGRELVSYMRSVGKFFGDEMYERMTDLLVEHYPDPALLLAAWDHAFEDPNPAMRGLRVLDRNFKSRHKKRYGKYHVARDIKARLDKKSLNLYR